MFCYMLDQAAKQTVKLSVFWDGLILMRRHCNYLNDILLFERGFRTSYLFNVTRVKSGISKLEFFDVPKNWIYWTSLRQCGPGSLWILIFSLFRWLALSLPGMVGGIRAFAAGTLGVLEAGLAILTRGPAPAVDGVVTFLVTLVPLAAVAV